MTAPAAGAEWPRVYVLLLNWRGWADTIECLETVFRQDYPNLRVVVCDNDSGDESVERIRAWAAGRLEVPVPASHPLPHLVTPAVAKPIPFVELERAEAEGGGKGEPGDAPLAIIQTGGNLGFAGGNNVGIRYALRDPSARYVWLLNNDTLVDPAALREMVRVGEADAGVAMVGSRLLDFEAPHRMQAAGGGRVRSWRGLTTHVGAGDAGEGQWESSFRPDYITGASLLARLEAVESIGEMNEGYFLYSEEVDWCLRARRAGFALEYAPGSRVWHKGGRSVGYGSSLHDYHTVRSMLLLVRNFYPHLLPVTFVYSLGRCLAPKVVRLQGERFRAVIRAYRDFFFRTDPRPRAPRPVTAAPPPPRRRVP